MTKDNRIQYSFLALALGIGLRVSPVLNIIHELFHCLMAHSEGISVIQLNWSSIVYARSSIIVAYAGYTGEFLFYSTIVLCLSIGMKQAKSYKIKPGHKILASFFLGVLLISWIASFSSYDYNSLALKILKSQEAVTRQLIIWGSWTSLCMIGLLKIYFTRWE